MATLRYSRRCSSGQSSSAASALAASAVGAVTNLDQFLQSWLIGFLFCLGLALGSLGLLMLQHLSGGQWGLVGRRVFEAGSRTLPLVACSSFPSPSACRCCSNGRGRKRRRTRSSTPRPATSTRRSSSSAPVIYFAFWLVLVTLLNRWSAEQDRGRATSPADSVRFRKVSAPGLLFLVITMTFASVDWIMSLDPEWFSTIFGLLTVVGWGMTTFALTIIVLSCWSGRAPRPTS